MFPVSESDKQVQIKTSAHILNRKKGTFSSSSAERYSLCTSWSAIDLNEPHFKALVDHKIKAEELETLIGQVLSADCWLDTRQTAPGKSHGKIIAKVNQQQSGW